MQSSRQQSGYDSLDIIGGRSSESLTHYLFRYPAKFHPPIARALLQRYSQPGDKVLDPFCGSGTLLVEAAVMGRHGTGVDIDPVAVEVSTAKTRPHEGEQLTECAKGLLAHIDSLERPASEYERRMFEDVDERTYNSTVKREQLWIPDIPNVFHWFRRYVLLDLARLWQSIIEPELVSEYSRPLFRVVFASIIRNCSNADPVPVSGLEVTSHMRRRDLEGRLINPYEQFRRALKKTLARVSEYSEKRPFPQQVLHGDALDIAASFDQQFDSVITSPPYHNAVDYYRRHQLEMFWLGHVASQRERLSLLPRYIGRHRVPSRHPALTLPWIPGPTTADVEKRMAQQDPQRANDFRAYCASMGEFFRQVDKVVKPDGVVVLVVGRSTWSGETLATETLMTEAASGLFQLSQVLSYPVKNRYMSYTRRNGADISYELVMELRR